MPLDDQHLPGRVPLQRRHLQTGGPAPEDGERLSHAGEVGAAHPIQVGLSQRIKPHAHGREASGFGASPVPRCCGAVSSRHCAAIADRIYDDIIQELSALSLSLGAESDHDDLTDGEREALRTRTRAIQQCSRFLGAVAERLMGLDGPSEAVAPRP